jgi:hypothetical protein
MQGVAEAAAKSAPATGGESDVQAESAARVQVSGGSMSREAL